MITILSALLRYLKSSAGAVVSGWDRFFFHPKDPVMLGVIRIVVGLVLLYIHLSCASEALNFLGPEAWVDQQALPEIANLPNHKLFQPPEIKPGTPPEQIPAQHVYDHAELQREFMRHYGWSIWYGWVTDPYWVLVTYYTGIVIVGLFTLGLLTPVTAVLTWLFHINYLHRSLMIWFGMDAMISFLTLYLMLSPCGKTFSLDRLLRGWFSGRPMMAAAPMWTANLGLRLIQLHICVVYFISGISKLAGHSWWLGNAAWLTMNAPLFNESLDAAWIADERYGEWFWHYVSFAGTYATLGFEIAFPFLIWNKRLRPWMLFLAFMLHLGIGLFMGLGAFGLVMLAGCMAFIPASGMRWFVECLVGKRIAGALM
jgi:hypothetical protein